MKLSEHLKETKTVERQQLTQEERWMEMLTKEIDVGVVTQFGRPEPWDKPKFAIYSQLLLPRKSINLGVSSDGTFWAVPDGERKPIPIGRHDDLDLCLRELASLITAKGWKPL